MSSIEHLKSFAELANVAHHAGQGTLRWKGVDGLSNVSESVIEHTNSMIVWSYGIEESCPGLGRAINWEKVRKTIMFHDWGEFENGDITMENQLNGVLPNDEKASFAKLIRELPERSQEELYTLFSEFEKTEKSDDRDVLMAVVIDKLQGDYFYLTNNNPACFRSSEMVQQILEMRLIPASMKLFKVLGESWDIGAQTELLSILSWCESLYKSRGIDIDLQIDKRLKDDTANN